MPRVTVNITAPSEALNDEFLTFDLPPETTLANFKELIQSDTNIPASIQQFFLNGQPLSGDDRSLDQAGIKDGDLLVMFANRGAAGGSGQARGGGGSAGQSGSSGAGARGGQGGGQRRGRPSADQIETLRLNFLADPARLASMRSEAPDLYEAREDSTRFREIWERRVAEEERVQVERQNRIALLNDDPFNVDAQREIEEMIRQANVMQNLQEAYEATPEVFGSVTMLYIPTLVNKTPVKAFVDSGAQATVMSPSCAERCGISRLLDTRFSGLAKGVGTAKIIGRVHKAEIQIGSMIMDCSFTVMEGKDVDLLFGLDNLKRFQACIDLRRNCLVLEGTEVPFLGEADIPKMQQDAMEDEPTFQGPNGTEIGARTGAVKPAGTSAAAHQQVASQKAPAASSSNPATASGQSSTAGAAPAAAAPAAATTQGQAGSRWPQASIEQLVQLGFSRAEAVAALDATDGNLEMAAGMLFG